MEHMNDDSPVNVVQSFFVEACSLVDVDKAQMYGDGTENMKRIARLWSEYLGVDIRPKDVAAMMVLHKVSRVAGMRNRPSTNTHDSWIDIAGYAALGDSVY